MARHSWTNRIIPPVVAAIVVGCVWYALQNRPITPTAVPATKASTIPAPPNAQSVAGATTLPNVSPMVKKLGTQLQFSVDPTPYMHVQKVEFYVEAQFVGAAYSQPYSVAVSEDNLTAGTHTVTAKIYLAGSSTKSSQPATFTATPKAPPAPAADGDTRGAVVPTTPPSSSSPATPASPTALPAPTDLSGTASSDGTSATLSWNSPEAAKSYQVWRDGAQVATTIGTGYTDTGLNPGQTYDFSVIAVDADNNASATSDMLAVTMPTPTPLADNPEDTQVVKPGTQSPSLGTTDAPRANDTGTTPAT